MKYQAGSSLSLLSVFKHQIIQQKIKPFQNEHFINQRINQIFDDYEQKQRQDIQKQSQRYLKEQYKISAFETYIYVNPNKCKEDKTFEQYEDEICTINPILSHQQYLKLEEQCLQTLKVKYFEHMSEKQMEKLKEDLFIFEEYVLIQKNRIEEIDFLIQREKNRIVFEQENFKKHIIETEILKVDEINKIKQIESINKIPKRSIKLEACSIINIEIQPIKMPNFKQIKQIQENISKNNQSNKQLFSYRNDRYSQNYHILTNKNHRKYYSISNLRRNSKLGRETPENVGQKSQQNQQNNQHKIQREKEIKNNQIQPKQTNLSNQNRKYFNQNTVDLQKLNQIQAQIQLYKKRQKYYKKQIEIHNKYKENENIFKKQEVKTKYFSKDMRIKNEYIDKMYKEIQFYRLYYGELKLKYTKFKKQKSLKLEMQSIKIKLQYMMQEFWREVNVYQFQQDIDISKNDQELQSKENKRKDKQKQNDKNDQNRKKKECWFQNINLREIDLQYLMK